MVGLTLKNLKISDLERGPKEEIGFVAGFTKKTKHSFIELKFSLPISGDYSIAITQKTQTPKFSFFTSLGSSSQFRTKPVMQMLKV
jgi:hypothetical protein